MQNTPETKDQLELIPGRHRLTLQERFAIIFENRITKLAETHQRVVCRGDYVTAEQLQRTLCKEMELAVEVIKGNAIWEELSEVFDKESPQGAEMRNRKLLLEQESKKD